MNVNNNVKMQLPSGGKEWEATSIGEKNEKLKYKNYECTKKIMEISKSLKVFCEIVEWACYVYFQLKSLTKSTTQKNLLKSRYFWIPWDIF